MLSQASSLYNIHGLLKVGLSGVEHDLVRILDSTLSNFKLSESNGSADLMFILGRFPQSDWKPKGYTVGDRIMYDSSSGTTIIFKHPINREVSRHDVEYVLEGDVRAEHTPVRVYVPNLPTRQSRIKAIMLALARLKKTRVLLATLNDNAILDDDIEEEAAKIRLAILEPFLYYRLPLKGTTLVHASSVCKDGNGIMFSGSGHIGKTTLAIELMKMGFSYVGEDLVIANDKGDVFSYPEPVRVQPQLAEIIPNVYEVLLANMNPIKRSFISKIAKHSPDEFLRLRPRVPATELVRNSLIADRCKISATVFIKRGSLPEAKIKYLEAAELGDMLSAELFWEFEAGHWRHNQYLLAPAISRGEEFLEQEQVHRQNVRKILRSSVSSCSRILVEVPYMWETNKLLDFIHRELIKELLQ